MSIRTTSPATQTNQASQASAMTQSTGQCGTLAVPHEKIATRAYEKWCQRGCTHGTHQQDWLEAEAELTTEMLDGKGKQTMQQTTGSRPAQAMAAPAPQKSAQRR